MEFKEPEIESIVDYAIEEILSEVFSGEISGAGNITYALCYLKKKVSGLHAEDFEL